MSSHEASIPNGANDDFVACVAGLAPGGAVAKLRDARGEVARYTQGSHDALFAPHATELTLTERLAAACYAARLSSAPEAAHAYGERLRASGASADAALALLGAIEADGIETALGTAGHTRLAAILLHTHVLIMLGDQAGKAALARLQKAGLSTRAIVALAQLVSFVAYQVRVISALRALEAKA